LTVIPYVSAQDVPEAVEVEDTESAPELSTPDISRTQLKELVQPAVMRIVQRLEGSVEIVPFELDLVNLEIIEAPEDTEWSTEQIDMYILGNGALTTPSGTVLANAHLVSWRSLYTVVATPIANEIFKAAIASLSDEELAKIDDAQLGETAAAQFSDEILQYIITKSRFNVSSTINLIEPEQAGLSLREFTINDTSAVTDYINESFIETGVDYALIDARQSLTDTLPVGVLGDTQDVYAMIYPDVIGTDTTLIYDGILVKGAVTATDDGATVVLERPVSVGEANGPIFDNTGVVVGMLSKPVSQTDGEATVFALSPMEPVVEKMNALGIAGFTESAYRDTMLAYFNALNAGDTELAASLKAQMGGAGAGEVGGSAAVGDSGADANLDAIGPQPSDRVSAWDAFVDFVRAPFASFSLFLEEGADTNPLNTVILVGSLILAFVLVVVMLWVGLKLRRHRIKQEEVMNEVPGADVIPPSDFSSQKQHVSESAQNFLQEGVRTMHGDTPEADSKTGQQSVTADTPPLTTNNLATQAPLVDNEAVVPGVPVQIESAEPIVIQKREAPQKEARMDDVPVPQKEPAPVPVPQKQISDVPQPLVKDAEAHKVAVTVDVRVPTPAETPSSKMTKLTVTNAQDSKLVPPANPTTPEPEEEKEKHGEKPTAPVSPSKPQELKQVKPTHARPEAASQDKPPAEHSPDSSSMPKLPTEEGAPKLANLWPKKYGSGEQPATPKVHNELKTAAAVPETKLTAAQRVATQPEPQSKEREAPVARTPKKQLEALQPARLTVPEPKYPQIVTYVRATRKKGFTDEQIQNALDDAGWRSTDITDAFNFLHS
jgi:hypothetical protein